MKISTATGESVRQSIYRITPDHVLEFGFNLRPVTFADHRSGMSALRLQVCFWRWCWCVNLLTWNTPRPSPESRQWHESLFTEKRPGSTSLLFDLLNESSE